MDLRKMKTLRAIRESFFELRKRKRLESITVTELCQIAEISKAAFYLHYRDIYDLSEKLQTESIESIFSRIEDPMLSLSNPILFTHTFMEAVETERDRINILFSDSQAGALPASIVSHLKENIFARSPQLRQNPEISVYLTYTIMGSYYACIESGTQLEYLETLKILEKIQQMVPTFI